MDRFWSKVEKTPTCWIWKGGKRGKGYGGFWTDNKQKLAHRFAYELVKGKIPEGKHIDHLCKNRICVNPDHLEVVTPKENIQRGDSGKIRGEIMKSKTHCPQGHEYTPHNTRLYDNRRFCKQCQKDLDKKRRELKRQKQNG